MATSVTAAEGWSLAGWGLLLGGGLVLVASGATVGLPLVAAGFVVASLGIGFVLAGSYRHRSGLAGPAPTVGTTWLDHDDAGSALDPLGAASSEELEEPVAPAPEPALFPDLPVSRSSPPVVGVSAALGDVGDLPHSFAIGLPADRSLVPAVDLGAPRAEPPPALVLADEGPDQVLAAEARPVPEPATALAVEGPPGHAPPSSPGPTPIHPDLGVSTPPPDLGEAVTAGTDPPFALATSLPAASYDESIPAVVTVPTAPAWAEPPASGSVPGGSRTGGRGWANLPSLSFAPATEGRAEPPVAGGMLLEALPAGQVPTPAELLEAIDLLRLELEGRIDPILVPGLSPLPPTASMDVRGLVTRVPEPPTFGSGGAPNARCVGCGGPAAAGPLGLTRCWNCDRAVCTTCFWRYGPGPGLHLCPSCFGRGGVDPFRGGLTISGGRRAAVPRPLDRRTEEERERPEGA